MDNEELKKEQDKVNFYQSELDKIRDTEEWLDFLSHAKECDYKGFDEQQVAVNFFRGINVRILYWSLYSYREEIQKKLKEINVVKTSAKCNNRKRR